METRAQSNRKIRQEALRDQLANQKHVEHVVDIIEKLEDPTLEQKDIQRLKTAAELRMKLIAKYLPDVKQMELTGEGGEKLSFTINNA